MNEEEEGRFKGRMGKADPFWMQFFVVCTFLIFGLWTNGLSYLYWYLGFPPSAVIARSSSSCSAPLPPSPAAAAAVPPHSLVGAECVRMCGLATTVGEGFPDGLTFATTSASIPRDWHTTMGSQPIMQIWNHLRHARTLSIRHRLTDCRPGQAKTAS